MSVDINSERNNTPPEPRVNGALPMLLVSAVLLSSCAWSIYTLYTLLENTSSNGIKLAQTYLAGAVLIICVLISGLGRRNAGGVIKDVVGGFFRNRKR